MYKETGQSDLAEPMSPTEREYRQNIVESFELAGHTESVEAGVMDRLRLLEQASEFNKHARTIMYGVENVQNKMALADPERFKVDEAQRTDIATAAIIHDIGKSGPAKATVAEQMLIIDLFELPIPAGGINATIRSMIESSYAGGAKVHEEMLAALANCGVSENMTMRQYYDLHALWTKDILEVHPTGFSQRTKVIAASHHIDRGINPYNIDPEQVSAARVMGALEEYSDILQGRLLAVMDKYTARVERSKVTHGEAVDWLKKFFADKYEDDFFIHEIIHTLEQFDSSEEVFGSLQKTAGSELATAA